MSETAMRRLTAWSGVAIGVGSAALVPLYFSESGPPAVFAVLTRDLINLILATLIIVVITGLCGVVRRRGADGWLVFLMYGAGLIYVAVTLIATSLEAGAVLGQPNGTVDPTTDGPLAHGAILLHGSISRIVSALFLGAAGRAVVKTSVVSKWIGYAAYLVALINLAFVPSIYFGTDAARFYSALGWGNTAVTASLITYWMMAVGVALLRPLPQRAEV